MNRVKVTLVAAIYIALVFTFSCSSDGGGGDELKPRTYYVGLYGVTDQYACYEIFNDDNGGDSGDNEYNENVTFNEVLAVWTEVRQLDGQLVRSRTNVSESELRDFFINLGLTPSETTKQIQELNKRGNKAYLFHEEPPYCASFLYIEKE
jgi:hypothetical protein